MRRGAIAAVFGGAIALAGSTWYGLIKRDLVTDVQVGGVALHRVALGAVAGGAVLLLSGAILTVRARRAEAAVEAEKSETEGPEYVWPTIVVRRHGRPRRSNARVVTLPPPTWATPSPYHPSIVPSDPPQLGPSIPVAVGDGWLPDNVQRLPQRG